MSNSVLLTTPPHAPAMQKLHEVTDALKCSSVIGFPFFAIFLQLQRWTLGPGRVARTAFWPS